MKSRIGIQVFGGWDKKFTLLYYPGTKRGVWCDRKKGYVFRIIFYKVGFFWRRMI